MGKETNSMAKMERVDIRVRSYPSGSRSYHLKKGRICEQDGFRITSDKKSDDPYGVISFEEAFQNRGGSVTKKIGKTGQQLIKTLAGCSVVVALMDLDLVSSSQLSLHFKYDWCRKFTNHKPVDREIGDAIGSVLNMKPRLHYREI